MCLTAPGGKIPKDLSWAAGKKFMGNVDAFLKSLLSFDKDNVPVVCVDTVEKDYISNPGFRPENIKSKSSAAAGLCGWVLNICKYFRIYQVGCSLVYTCIHKGQGGSGRLSSELGHCAAGQPGSLSFQSRVTFMNSTCGYVFFPAFERTQSHPRPCHRLCKPAALHNCCGPR